MGSNHAEINVSNYTGQGGHVTLKAVIEQTLSDNAISGSRFSQIRAVLEVIPRDLDVTKTLAGSGGVTYTARRKVCLCTKAPGGWRSENLDFYIIETQERHTMGRDGIVLGKASADRLFLNDTSKHVAPTCLDKGNDPKKFDKRSEEKGKTGREKAQQADAESERIKKERSANQTQSASNKQPR
ncbi:hypothetical protein ASPSYDRAFT_40312 [Aspergillus sydowii CBS 593.65]|uniref:Uncharacterized protein n=1 Tax=Aspergillus sydowii CBS 593.65 TaxID=1036612 RepID=A0A1L9TR58_9EURO|nr:uncharacterized protein ASPSYDRAFT_40312 [Aspergillus sydowii CBS 593.65]OJJ61773.1 hypothetical protein ASPSYDRAFT_40312 [Aspergillus sydowii CBS 593.65]